MIHRIDIKTKKLAFENQHKNIRKKISIFYFIQCSLCGKVFLMFQNE